jgi:hypothetical protein
MTERDKSITGIWGTIKTYPVLIQFKEICCGEHIEDEKVCDEMKKKYSPPPGVDSECDCFVENLKIDAIGDKMTDKGFPSVRITFYLPKVRIFKVYPYVSEDLYGWYGFNIGIDLEKPLMIRITRNYNAYMHRYGYNFNVLPPQEKSKQVIIEKPRYIIRGWVDQKKDTLMCSTPEIIDIEPPDKGRLSYVVLIPEYDVVINVEPDGVANVIIVSSTLHPLESTCIFPLLEDLSRKISG